MKLNAATQAQETNQWTITTMPVKHISKSDEERIYDAPNGWRYDNGSALTVFDADMNGTKLWGGKAHHLEEDGRLIRSFDLADEPVAALAVESAITITEPGQVVTLPQNHDATRLKVHNPDGHTFVVETQAADEPIA